MGTVVIVGVGAVSAHGPASGDLWNAVVSATPHFVTRDVSHPPGCENGRSYGAFIRDDLFSETLGTKGLRHWSRESMAMVAAAIASHDGVARPAPDKPERKGVYIGTTGSGATAFTKSFFAAMSSGLASVN